jgi:hypothetical protein
MGVRQARLRPEYASWYPTITVAGWISAMTAGQTVRRQLVQHEPGSAPRWEVGARLLDELHFIFRGGRPRDSDRRTRAGD